VYLTLFLILIFYLAKASYPYLHCTLYGMLMLIFTFYATTMPFMFYYYQFFFGWRKQTSNTYTTLNYELHSSSRATAPVGHTQNTFIVPIVLHFFFVSLYLQGTEPIDEGYS
jgi:hypothetical protein